MLELSADISREVTLAEPPERVSSYVQGNEPLLRRILGSERVEFIEPALYRFSLYPIGALGISFRPVFDLFFERSGDMLLKMSSVGFSFFENSHRDLSMDVQVWAKAALSAIPEGTAALVQASARVSMEVPLVLRLLPARMLEIAGNAVLDTTMRTFADRVIPILREELAALRVIERSSASL